MMLESIVHDTTSYWERSDDVLSLSLAVFYHLCDNGNPSDASHHF
jgi:hypothetical protein